METKDLEKRVDKLEGEYNELKEFVNSSIEPIKIGIAEIKVMLKEKLEQESLKNSLLKKDIENHESRIKKIEDNTSWLWKTIAGAIITIVIGAIVFVIQLMK